MATERDPKDSPFFKAGADAFRSGIKLENSALRKLRPGCKEYDWFIAGYDSVETVKTKASREPVDVARS